jgi:hypothetical protein
VAATRSSTTPLVGYWMPTKFGLNEDSIPFNESVISYVASSKIADVVLAARWTTRVDGNETANMDFTTALTNTIHRIREMGARPWIVLNVPEQDFEVPLLLLKMHLRNRSYRSLLAAPQDGENGLHGSGSAVLELARGSGARLLDPRPAFLDADIGRYIVEKNGVILYYDSHHLTASGARLMLLPLLRSEFDISGEAKPAVAGEVFGGRREHWTSQR